MNLNGTSLSVMNGADTAPLAAIVATPAAKNAALLALSRLMIWVAPEQRVRE